jgi:hypothetical protein
LFSSIDMTLLLDETAATPAATQTQLVVAAAPPNNYRSWQVPLFLLSPPSADYPYAWFSDAQQVLIYGHTLLKTRWSFSASPDQRHPATIAVGGSRKAVVSPRR